MTWTKHISRTYNVPYWHNSITNEYVWVQPADFIEYKEEKKITTTNPTHVVKTKVEKPRQHYESSSNSRQVSNSNGISYTIEGQSHWTNEDYREALRDLNQALREY
jgi:hypothetical protein